MAQAHRNVVTILLSASVPDPRRDPRFFATADPLAIREAIRALATVVLGQGRMVFGGHPAISPLIALIAKQLGAMDRVTIFQSEWFRSVVPADSLAFPLLKWTPADPTGLEASLEHMRHQMISSETFEAGVFIGGMEGVLDEFEMLRALQPKAAVVPVASTGAAARELFDRHSGLVDQMYRNDVESDLVYGDLFMRIMSTL